ncbi:MAG: 2-phospho-L-lactate guanylyltransferase [Candidatus Bathyarchaeia archaeon]
MKVYAIIPVKELSKSKTRLSLILNPKEREALSLIMLKDVLNALFSSKKIEKVIIVSSDSTVLNLYEKLGFKPLLETNKGDLNLAINEAIQFSLNENVQAVLIMPSDIPLVKTEDIDFLINNCDEKPSIIISPSKRMDGTNALLLHPPTILNVAYGENSFNIHVEKALKTKAQLKIIVLPRIALDIDIIEDLRDLIKFGDGTLTKNFLINSGLTFKI